MFYVEIRTKQDLSYISVCLLSILYHSKFILMAFSLGTNNVVVTRVHCIHCPSSRLRMNIKEIVDRKGRTFHWDEADGYGWFVEMSKATFKKDLEEQMAQVKNFQMKDDDVLICAFPKAGLFNTSYEIVFMRI